MDPRTKLAMVRAARVAYADRTFPAVSYCQISSALDDAGVATDGFVFDNDACNANLAALEAEVAAFDAKPETDATLFVDINAYHRTGCVPLVGLDRRDLFAMAALTGMLARSAVVDDYARSAEEAYTHADWMLAVREWPVTQTARKVKP